MVNLSHRNTRRSKIKTQAEKKKNIDDSNHSHLCSVLSKRFLFMFFSSFLFLLFFLYLLYLAVHSFKCVQYNSFMLVVLFSILFSFLVSYLLISIYRKELKFATVWFLRNRRKEEKEHERTEKVICFVFKWKNKSGGERSQKKWPVCEKQQYGNNIQWMVSKKKAGKYFYIILWTISK